MSKGRWWVVILVAGVVYLGVAGCVIFTTQAGTGAHTAGDGSSDQPILASGHAEGLPFRGVAMQVQRIDDMMDYGRSVDKIAALGADTIEFVVDAKQENGKSTRIFIDVRSEPTQEKLGALIDYAHSRKLRVVLMPIVLMDAPIDNEWRGTIGPAVWEDWWDSYREMIHYYDQVAEQHHVEMFAVGSELNTTYTAKGQWTRTIRQARGEFHGMLTYSANWDRYDTFPCWDQLDVMGMNSYFSLTSTKPGANEPVTVQSIDRYWAEIQKDILNYGRKIKKPVVMMEVGWCSQANQAKSPWDYTQESEPIDLDLQRKLYEGFFETWYGKKGFGGFMLWAWSPNSSGPLDRGYTPEGKPAEAVVKEWFAKGTWPME